MSEATLHEYACAPAAKSTGVRFSTAQALVHVIASTVEFDAVE